MVQNRSVWPPVRRLDRKSIATNVPKPIFLNNLMKSASVNGCKISTHFFRISNLGVCLWLTNAHAVLMIFFENSVTKIDVPAPVENSYVRFKSLNSYFFKRSIHLRSIVFLKNFPPFMCVWLPKGNTSYQSGYLPLMAFQKRIGSYIQEKTLPFNPVQK